MIDGKQLVSDVFEFFVEVITVIVKPLLYAFEQIAREVLRVTLVISVSYDVIEDVIDELLVFFLRWGEASFVEPCGRPCYRVNEHFFIFIITPQWSVLVTLLHDVIKQILETLLINCFHGFTLRIE